MATLYRDALRKAVAKLLRPLVRIFLRNGVTLDAATEIRKRERQ